MNEYRGLTYRQRNIIEILQHKDFATIGELADLCQVSNPTIRRDLIYLESIKFIERFYGGAKINTSRNIEILNYHKYYSHWAEKMRIGAKAAELVEDGDFIALNTGTTMMAFAQNLSRKKNLSIIVGDYEIARMLSQRNDFNVLITGGKIEREVPGLVGKFSVEMIDNFYFDKYFMGVRGLNISDGLMTSRYDQAITAQAFMKNSKKNIVITDSSKFIRQTGAIISPFNCIDILITDKGLLNFPNTYEQIKNIHTLELFLV